MNPLREISERQSQDVRSAVQASDSETQSSLDEIRQQITEEDYSEAFENLLTFFPSIKESTSEETVRRAYSYLLQIISHLDSSSQVEQLLERAKESIKHFPQCYDEQRQLALELGKWHFSNAQSFNETLRAMHYYGK